MSGGRALKSADAFAEYLDPLAVELNAAMGASRAAVRALPRARRSQPA